MRGRLALFCGLAGGLTVAMAATSHAQVVTTTTSSGGSSTTISDVVPAVSTPAFGTGAISGVVTDGKTGLPIEGALVHLTGGGQSPSGPRPGQMTDARGRFVFTHLPVFSDYVLSAARAGYMLGGYKRTPGVPAVGRIALRDREWLQTADIQLWKPASISGTVRDEHGDTVVGVPVRALVSVQVAGRRQQAAGPAAVTDDRGVYRLPDLQPGEYLVHVPSVQVTQPATTTPRPASASLPDVPALVRTNGSLGLMVGHFATPAPGSGALAYPMAFHPGALSPDRATPVSVGFGDQLENIDVQLALVPTVSVSGQVTGPADAIDKLPVRLLPVGSESLALGAEAAFTQTDAQGTFTLLKVPAGEYTLIASRAVAEYARSGGSISSDIMPRSAMMINSMTQGQVTGANGVWYSMRATAGTAVSGRTLVSVGDRDLTELVVPLTSGIKVSGHFLWDGQPTPPESLRLEPTVHLEPADGDLSTSVRNRRTARPEGQAFPSPVLFNVEGVLQGRYLFAPIDTAGFWLEAVELNGRDLLTTPLEVDGSKDVSGVVVRLTSKPISLSGAVTDASGAPAASGAVLTFPASPALWRNFGLSANLFKTSTVVASGTYRVDRLVPGDYLVVAVPDEDRSKWVDPDFLSKIAGQAIRVRVEPGSTVTQNLRMVGGK